MVWAQIIMGAVNTITGMQTASAKKKVGEASYKLEKGRATNKFMTDAAMNTLSAANAEVDRANQARQNRQTMKSLERNMEMDAFNMGKQVDGLNSKRFEDRIAGAAALGTLAATAASTGVGGGSIQTLNETELFRQERADQGLKDQVKDAGYVQALNQSAMLDQAYNSLDDSLVVAGFNYAGPDFVMDNRMQNKYGLHNAVGDFANGFSGNMDKVGVNLQGAGYQGQSIGSLFGGSGGSNKGLGGGGKIGAPREGGNTGGMGMPTTYKSYTRL